MKEVATLHDNETFDGSFLQIRLFLAVVQEQSFTQAAVKMNVEPSTLSRRISTLESALDTVLFRRDARPIQLTPEGELLNEYWKPLMSQLDHSIEKLRTFQRKNRGQLAVSVFDSSSINNDMLEISREMLAQFSDLSFVIEYVPLYRWRLKVLQGDVDVYVTTKLQVTALDDRFVSETIVTFPKLVCMLKTNPLSRKDAICLEDLKDQNFITHDEENFPEYSPFVRRICRDRGFEPHLGKVILNAHGFAGALQTENQVFVCDRLLRGYDSPLFKVFEIPNVDSGLCAVWLRGNNNPFIPRYLDCLRKYFGSWNTR